MTREDGSVLELKKKKKSRKEKEGSSTDHGTKRAETAQPTTQDNGLGVEVTERKKKKKKTKDTEELALSHFTKPYDAVTEIPKKKKKRVRTESEAKTVDGSTVEPMQVDEPPTSEESERKKKRKKREDAPDDGTSKKEKKKRRRTDGDAPQTLATPVPSGSTPSSTPTTSEIEEYLQSNSITLTAAKNGSSIKPVLNFDQLQIPPELKASLSGFQSPTPIQACSWPPALKGQDVVGIAETGSGKTLAFGIPAISRLIMEPESKGIQVLVMSPTRELAIQTQETLFDLGKPYGIESVAVFGGLDKNAQIKALKNKKAKIVVGTPGRIMDLVNDGALVLSGVTYLVLDEADRMLDKGFENDIRTIVGYTTQGEGRQTLMFSATWPDSVRKLAATFQRDPIRVTVGSDDLTANSRIEQVLEVFDDTRSKKHEISLSGRLLGHLRKAIPRNPSKSPSEDNRVLVFVLYKAEAARVESYLREQKFAVAGLHGDMPQRGRLEALASFKLGESKVLVATDVAARGLDIPNVGLVINYTFPLTIEDYIHRIGRTGRGRKSGKSITFFTGEKHERSLAGELARVVRESGFDIEPLKKFPMTIKKKTHSVYGAFYRDDVETPSEPTKIVF
ncbi:DEAD-domain-containing protein [Thelephora terrestris]|uniref:RNA helicase n=1 Tax=Thelephora terrestris TaxID=56493 RepID=A0A9P6L6R1_9AGAM|nr:DEAD-domain-containing protein [Thelephora terrestris]